MEDHRVTFETAKLAKEKGFNWDSKYAYSSDGTLEGLEFIDSPYFNEEHIGFAKENGFDSYLCPSQPLLQKWLREKHNIHVQITREFYEDGISYAYQVLEYKPGSDNLYGTRSSGLYDEFESEEEALEEGLQEGLKLV